MTDAPVIYPEQSHAPVAPTYVAYDTLNRALVPTQTLQSWLDENTRGAWRMDFERFEGKSVAVMRFADSRDLILFKLWWSHHE